MLFAQVLATGLFLAWLAHAIGLAPIIGAFAAGLLFEPMFLKHFETPRIVQEAAPLLPEGESGKSLRSLMEKHARHQHESMIEPIGYFFVPVFFVLTGMQVDLATLADPKLVHRARHHGRRGGRQAGRRLRCRARRQPWIVGWGMVPRGEVGLIFAVVGKKLGVLGEAMFSVIVIMVILTTLLTPPILTLLLRRP
jgi:Kef-type K+ transport system membrane component KefB